MGLEHTCNALEILKRRSSCRNYTGEQITNEELKILLEAGNAAPVALRRMEDIRLYIIQDAKRLEKLEANTQDLFNEIGYHMRALHKAPTLIIVAVRKMKAKQAQESENYWALSVQKALYCSASCIIENMSIAATDLRLGSIFLTGVVSALNGNAELLKEIGIPEDFEAAGSLGVGRTEKEQQVRDLSTPKFVTEYR